MESHDIRDILNRLLQGDEGIKLRTQQGDYDPTNPDAASLGVAVMPGDGGPAAFFRITVEKVQSLSDLSPWKGSFNQHVKGR